MTSVNPNIELILSAVDLRMKDINQEQFLACCEKGEGQEDLKAANTPLFKFETMLCNKEEKTEFEAKLQHGFEFHEFLILDKDIKATDCLVEAFRNGLFFFKDDKEKYLEEFKLGKACHGSESEIELMINSRMFSVVNFGIKKVKEMQFRKEFNFGALCLITAILTLNDSRKYGSKSGFINLVAKKDIEKANVDRFEIIHRAHQLLVYDSRISVSDIEELSSHIVNISTIIAKLKVLLPETIFTISV